MIDVLEKMGNEHIKLYCGLAVVARNIAYAVALPPPPPPPLFLLHPPVLLRLLYLLLQLLSWLIRICAGRTSCAFYVVQNY